MLIEDLVLGGYNVISANTDGVLLHIKKDQLDAIRDVYKKWELVSGFTLEEAYFTKYVRRDINNYCGVTPDGKIKNKGDFIPYPGLKKGWEYPIIAKALLAYYLEGIEPETFLYSATDIYDFCYSQKIGKQYTNYVYNIERKIVTHDSKGKEYAEPRNEDTVISQTKTQNIVRFYVSRPNIDDNGVMSGNVLKKVKREVKPVKTLIQEKVVIPAEYKIEQRINPASGRMKTYKDKVKEKEIIPAVYEMIEQEVVSESVLASGQFITMFNNYWHEEDFGNYNINYSYYIEKCMQEINKIGKI